jgi:glycosyltransferase involved in cell wall biosynthesis
MACRLSVRERSGGPVAEGDSLSSSAPSISIVIAVYNDWTPLDLCLQSLARQTDAPSFEVVIADDGSSHVAPEFIRNASRHYPLTIVRQPHKGISPARNFGIQNSRGSVVIFVDADCKLQNDSLAKLSSVMDEHPEHHYFQLRLIGDCSTLVGRAEELRLITIQKHMLQPDGHIRYLNTAGFAIRRVRTNISGKIFDPDAQRAEDTLLLANLMQSGELPWFVKDAVVQHAIPLSLFACLFKGARSAYMERWTHNLIAAKGIKFRVSHRERLSMLRSMWEISAQPSIGRPAWFVLAARQVIRFVMLLLTDATRLRDPGRISTKSS